MSKEKGPEPTPDPLEKALLPGSPADELKARLDESLPLIDLATKKIEVIYRRGKSLPAREKKLFEAIEEQSLHAATVATDALWAHYLQHKTSLSDEEIVEVWDKVAKKRYKGKFPDNS